MRAFSPGVRRAVPGGYPNAEPGEGQPAVPLRGAALERRTAQFGSAGLDMAVLRRVMCDTRPPTDVRQPKARIAATRLQLVIGGCVAPD